MQKKLVLSIVIVSFSCFWKEIALVNDRGRGDGWENIELKNNPLEVQHKTLEMGATIFYYISN